MSDPQNPAIVGSTNTPGLARGVFVIDQTAYVADGSYGLQIIDVSDRLDPYIVGSVDTPGEATGVSVIGQTAYVAALYAGLQVIDLSDPENPAIIGSLFEYAARGVFVIDRTAYVTSGGLDIIDVSDPQNPAITGSVDTPGFADEVVVIGQTAYVADYNSGLQAIDVSVAQNPVIIGSVDTFDTALSVAVTGNLAYVASGGRGLVIVPGPSGNNTRPDNRSRGDQGYPSSTADSRQLQPSGVRPGAKRRTCRRSNHFTGRRLGGPNHRFGESQSRQDRRKHER